MEVKEIVARCTGNCAQVDGWFWLGFPGGLGVSSGGGHEREVLRGAGRFLNVSARRYDTGARLRDC